MIVDVSTFLAAEPRQVETQLKQSRLLMHVASPIVKFIPYGATKLPESWEEGTYWLSLRLLGFIPLGKQAVVISYPESRSSFILRDNGHSMLVKKWDHQITIHASGAGTLYRDHVTIEAGLFTVLIWVFAQVFYRHRQRRWRQLVACGFDYDAT